LLFALALALTLSACNAGGGGIGTGANPTAAGETAGQSTEITWAFWGDPAEVEINEEVIRQFEEAHPEINIKVRHEPWSNYFNTVTPSLNTDDPPDVLFLFNIPAYAKDGVLENLAPYIERDQYPVEDYWQELLETYRYNGDLYGLPRDNDTSVVYYNAKILDEAGVAPPDETTTWDQFRAKLEELSVIEGDRVARYGLAMEQGKWRHWLWQTGHGVLDSNENPSECLLDRPESIEAVSWFNDLIQDRLLLTGQALENVGGDTGAFQGGQAAMIIQNASRIPTFNETPDLEYGLAPLPVHEGWKRAGQTGGAGYVIAANSDNKDAAWTFLQWLQSSEGQMAFVGETGALVPALRSVATSDDWQKLPPRGREAFVLETQSQAPPDGIFAEWNHLITEVIDPDMERIWAGDATPEELLPSTCEKAEEYLRANGYPRS
ncbi:MAG TPA: sugar ABC transporter substrate-binding protein, partial [Ardenticatenaceae bacterium]|nr:sugar ABC transporter substrate-binding protein [Ardenticatenaceae bacterium]